MDTTHFVEIKNPLRILLEETGFLLQATLRSCIKAQRNITIYSLRLKRHVFLNAAATSPTLKAWVDRLDVHNVWIRWSAQIEPDYCEYLYQPLEASQASVLSINELHRRLIHIGDLKAGYIYIFYIVCTASQDVHQSKHITFRTVMPAPRTPHPVLPEKSPKKIGPKLEMYPDTIDDSMSVTDIVLGAVFAVFGLAVISITGWYLWRKVQHRQRVANFVRHQDSADNFDAIHPPVDVAQS